MDSNDFQAVWNDEPTCQLYDYKLDIDMFKGKCDLKMRGGAASAATCCDACSSIPHCEAFTFYNGACFLKNCGRQGNGGVAQSLHGAISGYLK